MRQCSSVRLSKRRLPPSQPSRHPFHGVALPRTSHAARLTVHMHGRWCRDGSRLASLGNRVVTGLLRQLFARDGLTGRNRQTIMGPTGNMKNDAIPSTAAVPLAASLVTPAAAASSTPSAPSSQTEQRMYPWYDRGLSPDERARLVIEQMTQDEKFAWLSGPMAIGIDGGEKPDGAIGSAA